MIIQKRNRKSQSEVIVTVLIILLVIAAIAVVGFFLMKWIKGNTDFSNINLDISIEGDATYNPATNNLFIKVSRGVGDANLTGLKIIVTLPNGDSIDKEYSEELPAENEIKMYGRGNIQTIPEYVELAPIVTKNGITKVLDIASRAEVTQISSDPQEDVIIWDLPDADPENNNGNLPD